MEAMQDMDKRIFGLLAVVLVIGALIFGVSIHPTDMDTKITSQDALTKAGFDVTPTDAKASVSAELVEKEGVTYELLCKSTEIKQVKKIEDYACELNDYTNPIIKIGLNKTTDKNESIVIGYNKKQAICQRTIFVNGTICIKSGEVKVDDKIISKEGYMCGAGVCDEYRDSHGGGGDGNGNSICEKGETCVYFEEFVK